MVIYIRISYLALVILAQKQLFFTNPFLLGHGDMGLKVKILFPKNKNRERKEKVM